MAKPLSPWLAAAMLTLLGGCSMAPAYHPPVMPAPVAFKELPTAGDPVWKPVDAAAAVPPAAWWEGFGDPLLDQLELLIDRDNPTLAAALARYDMARATLAGARSGLFPRVELTPSLTRNRQSDERPLRGGSQPDFYTAATLGGDLSYEADLWGRVRNSVASGRALAEASRDDAAMVKLALQGQLATDFVHLRGQDQQLALLAQTIDAFAKADALTRNRFRGGIATGMDVGRAGALLGEARAQYAELQAARAVTEHAIASLVGQPASTFSIPRRDSPLDLPVIPVGLPSTLLARRPDVAAAERRMAAANARIGVAKAAFFPQVTLGGAGGFQSTALAGLVAAPNLFWAIGPGAILNLFDGGKRRADVSAARADWDAAAADYRSRALGAFQDVEDALATLHHLDDAQAAQAQAVASATSTSQIALDRYIKGAATYLDVATAQENLLRDQQIALSLQTGRLIASAALARALGGGSPLAFRAASTQAH
ncbi:MULTISPECIES: efflux transporter outer membrane subunit [Sphingomonas]|jgi:NodT family efflux transporter outer membrane factor (OMF) lipoprotein|uniref:Efflux transporter outer membrane subunit n=1 Tax=Sphingomonas zeae TaxID=1646122 RepID=A0A7Y6EIK9_9SPHN|nr:MULTISPECIES: efflux transporter outer membrane subunit [Sphingomonas]MBB4049459.1 NodT family efflux transporter outer membrane factor (OMF) lipoprotein [Sphingomonas zeae]MDK8186766.1 efflux transporter outer membrane subunit [Sphingomonas zeae]MDK8216430.1 efflux transporter outer membrane subunit [Sphingomonas sp. UMB7805-LC452B]NUU48247.1 efflux transporter outer membrane subunit [Sphingomonas zeae]